MIAQAPRRPVHVTEGVISGSHELLRRRHAARESIIYWAGFECEASWVLTTCIGPDATTNRGSFETSATANAQVISYLATLRLKILAQVHTHPDHRVGHSPGDDEGAFLAFPGFLSIVVPHYGQHGIVPFAACGVHEHDGTSFRRLNRTEVDATLRVLPMGVDFLGKARS